MIRSVFRAQCKEGLEEKAEKFFKDGLEAVASGGLKKELMRVAVFRWENNFFIYYENRNRERMPDELFGDFSREFEAWPGEDEKRYWVRMMDIYHCAEPVTEEFWERKQAPEKVFARLNRLKPEMVSSYIFYHYQLQEEKPASWAKYAAIYLHEDLMFFYQEKPDLPVKTPYPGKLATNNTPDNWQELMCKHFHTLDETVTGDDFWQEIRTVGWI